MTYSEIHQYTQTLRLHLLDMCRVSQRCVDYCIKGLQLKRLDISANIFDGAQEIDKLHREAGEIAQNLLLMGLLSQSSPRFASASMRICDALRAIHKSALEIAENSSACQEENGATVDCGDLATMGDLANRLMRLCTVALFEEEIEHAEAALRMETGRRLFSTAFYVWYRRAGLRPPSQAHFVRSIADRLDQLIWQMHEMSRAIVYWLEGEDHKLLAETHGFGFADCFAPGLRSLSDFELGAGI